MERMISANEVQKANRALTDAELDAAAGGSIILTGAGAATMLLAAPYASTAAAIWLLRK